MKVYDSNSKLAETPNFPCRPSYAAFYPKPQGGTVIGGKDLTPPLQSSRPVNAAYPGFRDRFYKTPFRPKNLSDKSCILKFYTIYFHVGNYLGFKDMFKHYKITITNLNLTKFGIIRKLRPKRFHKIDPRSSQSSWSSQGAYSGASAGPSTSGSTLRKALDPAFFPQSQYPFPVSDQLYSQPTSDHPVYPPPQAGPPSHLPPVQVSILLSSDAVKFFLF
jgi:hypothetical protein